MKPNLEFDTLLSIDDCKQRLAHARADVKAMRPLFARLQHATDGFIWRGPRGSGLELLLDKPILVILLKPNQAVVHVQGYFAPALISFRTAAIIAACFLVYFLVIARPSLPPIETILIIGLGVVIQPVFRLWYRSRWERLAQELQETLSDNTSMQ